MGERPMPIKAPAEVAAVAEKCGGAVYGYAHVKKLNNSGGGGTKAAVLLHSLIVAIMFPDTKGKRLGRTIKLTAIQRLLVDTARNELLIVPPEGEATLYLQFVHNPQNDPSNARDFAQAIARLYAPLRPQGPRLSVEETTNLRAHSRKGAKTSPLETMKSVVEERKQSRSSPPPSPQPRAASPAPEGSAPPSPAGGQPKPWTGPAGATDEEGNDVDSPLFLDPKAAPVFGQRTAPPQPVFSSQDLIRQGSPHTSPRPHPQLHPQPLQQQQQPRFVPGEWQAAEPYPEEPQWQMHRSRSADGRPYWHNPTTGENTWTPPPGHSYPTDHTPQRSRPPWIPMLGGPSTALGRREPVAPRPEPPRNLLSGGSPESMEALAVLRHAAACSGRDMHELLAAAHSVTGKGDMAGFVSV